MEVGTIAGAGEVNQIKSPESSCRNLDSIQREILQLVVLGENRQKGKTHE